MSATTGLIAVSAHILWISSAGAAEQPEPAGRISITRSASAAACAPETVLLQQLGERVPTWASAPPGQLPLFIDVQLESDSDGYSAKVRVSGRKSGLRRLRGPDCAEVEESVLALLEFLLDADPVTLSPARLLAEVRDFNAESSTKPKQEPPPQQVRFGAGVAVSAGLPYSRSETPFVEVVAQSGPWQFVAAMMFPQSATIPLGRGAVDLEAIGGQLAICRTLIASKTAAFSACGAWLGVLLRARARDFAENTSRERPWWLLGAGPEFNWSATPSIQFGLSARALASVRREAVDVSPLGSAYVTPAIVGWLAADAKVRFW